MYQRQWRGLRKTIGEARKNMAQTTLEGRILDRLEECQVRPLRIPVHIVSDSTKWHKRAKLRFCMDLRLTYTFTS